MLHNPNKLDHETQMSIFELFNGRVSLVHDSSMPDVANAAMQALLVLHQKENIEKWNPESPVNIFWSISSQVLFSISQKLVQHQIQNYTDVLKWLREILKLRNSFLYHYKDNAYVGSNIPMAKHAQLKLEIVFFVYLWSTDIDAVKTAMSCFSLFCEEAEIRFGYDESAVIQLLPNHNIYLELAECSNSMTIGRNALQKKILSLLRKIENPTQGNKQAWYDTFVYQQTLTKSLEKNYLKSNKNDDSSAFNGSDLSPVNPTAGSVSSFSHRIKRRNNGTTATSSTSINTNSFGSNILMGTGQSLANSLGYSNQSVFNSSTGLYTSMGNISCSTGSTAIGSNEKRGDQEHETDDLFYEWANMTGFLSALGSVWLPNKQQTIHNFLVGLFKKILK